MPSHGAALPDISRPSGFLSHKDDPAPVAALVTEAEDYVRESDPLMAGMGDGNGEPWVPERFVEKPALTKILEERGSRYGKFAHNADIAQALKSVFRHNPYSRYHEMAPDQREVMDMLASKQSRLLVGDPDYADNWRDIAGFATLVADRLEGK